MTLQEYAYVADVASAVAVIGTLLYLVRELRQNTNAIRVNNAHNYVDFYFKLNTPFATDRRFAELWAKGHSEFASLDSVDQQRLVVWEFQAIAGWSNYFNLRRQALITDAQWNELMGTFAIFGQRQSVREAWRMFRHIYDQPYRNFMAQYFESDSSSTDTK
jgi:hypothetical protein